MKGKKWFEFLKKLSPALPFLSAVLVAVCAVATVQNYTPAVYEVKAEEVDLDSFARAAQEEEEAAEKKEKAAKKKEKEEDDEDFVKGSFDLEDGVYEGSAEGYSGTVTVAVTIKDKQITDIEVLSYEDDDAFFERAEAVIDTIIERQSVDVDVVSGATYSSTGIINAVKNALTGETEEEDSDDYVKGSFDLDDGVYEGSAEGYSGTTTVAVTIKDKQITDINVLSFEDDSSFFNRAKGVIDTIIERQSVDVDVVSGATYSSNSIINAVKNALTGEVSSSDSPGASSSSGSASVETVDESNVTYQDGVYYGTGQGYSGTVRVKVTISDGKITDIEVVSHNDTDEYMNKAKALLSDIISGQTTNVSTVSGATYSSKGLIEAVRDALSQAETGSSSTDSDDSGNTKTKSGNTKSGSGKKSNAKYKDGTYTGKATCESRNFDYTVKLNVKIKDGKIKKITKDSIDGATSEDKKYFKMAYKGELPDGSSVTSVPSLIIKYNGTDVDDVSGATYSSKAIKEAVDKALSKASTKKTTPTPTPTPAPTPTPTPTPSTTIYQEGDNWKGSARCVKEGYFDYTVNVTVIIDSEGKISDIAYEPVGTKNQEDLDCFYDAAEGYEWGNEVVEGVISQMIRLNSANSDDIETVSGATYSSNALIEAVSKALDSALSSASTSSLQSTAELTSAETADQDCAYLIINNEPVSSAEKEFLTSDPEAEDISEDQVETETSVTTEIEASVPAEPETPDPAETKIPDLTEAVLPDMITEPEETEAQ